MNVALGFMESWERYKAMFENQPEWFFYVVTFLVLFGFCAMAFRLYVFSKYLMVGIVAIILIILGIFHLGDTIGWSYFDD